MKTGRFRDYARGIWYNKHVSKRRPVTDEEFIDIIKQRYTGVQTSDIAANQRRSARSIRQILRDGGVEPRFHPFAKLAAASPIEARLHDALKSAGIGFVTHRRYVKNYITDIRINQAPILIEADGIQHTWYDNPALDAQRDADHAAAGFRTFRFTGTEINTDAVKCIQSVIDECDLVPDKDPVYDVKIGFSGENHPRWVDDRQEYTCETCGDIFIRRRSYYANRRGVYCKAECYYESLRGRTLSEEHRRAIGAGNLGKHHATYPSPSEEVRTAISQKLTGKKKTPEHVAKVADALRGRTVDQEQRDKIGDSVKALPRMWCEECQRDWPPSSWGRHIRRYHEGGKW